MLLPKKRPRRLVKREQAAKQATEWKKRRAIIFARDQYLCRVCEKCRPYDAHHVLARSLGGREEPHNLIAVCRRCHEDIHGHVVVLRWTDETNRQGSLRIERVA